MKIVIPMAGYGRRFSDAGYDKIKPLINVLGKPMIQRVVENLYSPGCDFLFVLNGENDNSEIIDLIHSLIPAKFFFTNGKTDGPARTAMFACNEVYGKELLITNCDQIIDDFSLNNLRAFAKTKKADGVLGAFISSSPKNSYMKLNKNGEVEEIREKVVISNIATNGIHYWRDGGDFVESFTRMEYWNDMTNGEYYVAPSYNYMIEDCDSRILPYFYNFHYPIGTPEDLKKYEDIQTK